MGYRMKNTEVTLTNDYLFKRILGSEENKEILQDFLECVLDLASEKIEGLELIDKEFKKDRADDRTGILDIQVRLKNGVLIDIEMQLAWNSSFVARSLFYWSKMYLRDFKSGSPYSSLRRCISINIIGAGYNLDDALHSAFVLINPKTKAKMTDLMEFHFFNLEKLKDSSIICKEKKENKLVNWLRFINASNQEERNMLAATSPVLAILNEQVGKLNLSPEEQYLYESRMKLRSDIVSIQESSFNQGIEEGIEKGIKKGIKKGIEKGIEEGIEKGKKAGILATAKNLLNMGMSWQDVAKATGLSEEEIIKL